MRNIIIDLEFTGLDNTYISDNEIVQVKMLDIDNPKLFACKNFGSAKPIGAYGRMQGMPAHYEDERFGVFPLSYMIEKGLGISDIRDATFYGFSTKLDMKMLLKFGIELQIDCIQEMLMKTELEHAMATQGRSMEACYYLATGKIYTGSHSGIEELWPIRELYQYAQAQPLTFPLQYVPFGHCAGMPIAQYVDQYRRAADGHRFNNNDLFAQSLTDYIQEMEGLHEDDEGEDFWR